jgi:hypothetical protein
VLLHTLHERARHAHRIVVLKTCEIIHEFDERGIGDEHHELTENIISFPIPKYW